jgi:hypothetical protein
MKKSFLSLIFVSFIIILGIAIIVPSCKEEDNTSSIMSKTELSKNPYDFIGEIHNKGMNEFKNQLQIAKKDNQKVDVGSLVSKFMFDEINNSNLISAKESLLSNMNLSIAKVREQFNQNRFLKAAQSSNFSAIDTSILTSFQKTYIKSILTITSESDNIKEGVLKIESEVLKANVSDEEKAAVLCVIAITKYSYDFWTENIDLLQSQSNLASHSEEHLKSANNIEEITVGGAVTADACGAVEGAISSIVSGAALKSGLVFGPEGAVLTIAGASVLDGLVGSACYLALWSWLF